MPGPTNNDHDCPAYQAALKQINEAKTIKKIDALVSNAKKIIELADRKRFQLIKEAEDAEKRIHEIREAE